MNNLWADGQGCDQAPNNPGCAVQSFRGCHRVFVTVRSAGRRSRPTKSASRSAVMVEKNEICSLQERRIKSGGGRKQAVSDSPVLATELNMLGALGCVNQLALHATLARFLLATVLICCGLLRAITGVYNTMFRTSLLVLHSQRPLCFSSEILDRLVGLDRPWTSTHTSELHFGRTCFYVY